MGGEGLRVRTGGKEHARRKVGCILFISSQNSTKRHNGVADLILKIRTCISDDCPSNADHRSLESASYRSMCSPKCANSALNGQKK